MNHILLAILSGLSAAAEGTDSCVSCHQLNPMERLKSPVVGMTASVHASKGVSCADCHGGGRGLFDKQAAMAASAGFTGAPRGVRASAGLCARCHKEAYNVWNAGAHASTAQCAKCHGAHNVKKATLDIISPVRCSSCHPYPRADPLKTSILQARAAAASVQLRLQKSVLEGVPLSPDLALSMALETDIKRLFHMTGGKAIAEAVGKIRMDAAAIGAHAAELENEWKFRRRLWLGVVLAVSAAALTASYLLYHRIRTKRMLSR